MTAVSAGVTATATVGQAVCQERGTESDMCLSVGADWAALSLWVATGMGALGTFLLNFHKGNILFLYIFINLLVCAPWHFYNLLPTPALGLCPPVSCSTLPHKCLLLMPPRALRTHLSPAAAPAGAGDAWAAPVMPVLPHTMGVWLASLNHGAGCWYGIVLETEKTVRTRKGGTGDPGVAAARRC